jgi:Mn2+/Fe2+ NRAMP family transporter
MRTWKIKFKKFYKVLGPGLVTGLVTGASDDDLSGIATYSQEGAAYGLFTEFRFSNRKK